MGARKSAPKVRTRTPGIYKRGNRYVFPYKVHGRQKWESARTLAEARRKKAARTADVARGEFFEASRTTFREYAKEWVERYQGRGRRGFRESTREDYRRDLRRYAFEFFGERRRLSEVLPRDIANFIGWLIDERAQGERLVEEERRKEAEEKDRPLSAVPSKPAEPVKLADATVRRILAPVRSCLGTAMHEGLIRFNPTAGAQLPHRPTIEEEEREEARALTRSQLGIFLRVVHPRFRLFFEFLAATGLRFGEAIALEWRHIELDGSSPHVKVRQKLYRGRLETPKSRYGRRDVPLHQDLVLELRSWRRESSWPSDEEPVFPASNGAPLRSENLRSRVLKPAAEEAGVPWAGFHTFRHTCASMLFAGGKNAKQVQRWLGHHAPSLTLNTYTHLLDEGLGEALDVGAEVARVATPVPTGGTGTGDNAERAGDGDRSTFVPNSPNEPEATRTDRAIS